MPGFAAKLLSLFGEDIFISYSRDDGAAYAAGLASELSGRGLSVALTSGDPSQVGASQNLSSGLSEDAECSSLSGLSPQAALMQYLKTDQEFLKTRRLVVPVDVDGTIRQALWWPRLDGLAVSVEERRNPSGGPTRPAREVVDRIQNSVTFTRRNRRLYRIAAGTLIIIIALIGAAIFAADRVVSASLEFYRQQQLTSRATEARIKAEQEFTTSQARSYRRKLLLPSHANWRA